MIRRPRGDRGAAAAEAAAVMLVLMGLVGFVAPLPYAYYEKVQLERAAGHTVRFAASRPTVQREAVDSTLVRAGFRPSVQQAQAEARAAYTGRGRLATPQVVSGPGVGCPTLIETTVRLRSTISLGPAYAFLAAAGFTSPRELELRAVATHCRE